MRNAKQRSSENVLSYDVMFSVRMDETEMHTRHDVTMTTNINRVFAKYFGVPLNC